MAGFKPGYLCKNVLDMLTREQILEIDRYCAEHKVRLEARIDEIGVPRHQYYRWKKKYREEDAAGKTPSEGAFLQLSPGGAYISPMMSPSRSSGKSGGKAGIMDASYLTIELRTASGTAMRIQGAMTAAHLHEIISAG